MLLCLQLLLAFVHADSGVVYLPRPTPVYARANSTATLLEILPAKARVVVMAKGKVFARIKFQHAEKATVGYVQVADLVLGATSSGRGNFGFGLGGMFSYLRHAGKNFETEDQVNYVTKDFVSSAASPFILVQYGARDFWRAFVTYRMTKYESSANSDVAGAGSRELILSHKMYSFIVQKMWSPLKDPWLYCGVGAEVARAASADLSLGANKMDVSAQDLPTYVGGHLALGAQFDLSRAFSGFVEARLTGFFNQSPVITGGEAVAGLIYWP